MRRAPNDCCLWTGGIREGGAVMGQSTNGMLVYGYDLGGPEDGWKVAEAGEYGEWMPSWSTEDSDIITDAEKALMASVGFTETDWRAEGYFDREREAKARLGVEFESYCSADYPLWVLAACVITVYRGDAKEVDLAALEAQRTQEEWDAKLAAAVQALGIEPTQDGPRWMLVSYWG